MKFIALDLNQKARSIFLDLPTTVANGAKSSNPFLLLPSFDADLPLKKNIHMCILVPDIFTDFSMARGRFSVHRTKEIYISSMIVHSLRGQGLASVEVPTVGTDSISSIYNGRENVFW